MYFFSVLLSGLADICARIHFKCLPAVTTLSGAVVDGSSAAAALRLPVAASWRLPSPSAAFLSVLVSASSWPALQCSEISDCVMIIDHRNYLLHRSHWRGHRLTGRSHHHPCSRWHSRWLWHARHEHRPLPSLLLLLYIVLLHVMLHLRRIGRIRRHRLLRSVAWRRRYTAMTLTGMRLHMHRHSRWHLLRRHGRLAGVAAEQVHEQRALGARHGARNWLLLVIWHM